MTDSIELDMRDCVEDVERLYKMESSRRIDLSRRLHELFRLRHCLVVTCTRVLYFSDGDGQAPIEGLLRALHLDLLRGKARAVRRSGDDAVKHLYELSLGITSPLYGEDTIVGQIGQAVRTSEECGTCSAFLSRLFRDVVAFSREMHGKYRIRTFSDEIPLRVAAGLGKVRSVLVVGSGELARMVGAALVEKGIDVGMTLRDAEKTFLLPVGAKGIAYDERKAHVPSYDAVVSASSGLYHTFEKEDAPLFSGRILFDGADLSAMDKKELLSFRRSKISMVFQSFGLMSHRNVLGNVAYGLEIRGMPKAEREARAMEMISMVGLKGWEGQSCGQLSGGMRQRVGIARALANDPEVLLMDEPFSALDPLVRRDMQFELLQIQRKLQKTVVFITHDMDEAFKLGDTVAIMRDGKVIQVDTPEGMSTHPADDYVREFTGSANKSKVTSVQNIMITPSSLARLKDGPGLAIKEMRKNALSTVYVVDDRLCLVGILTIRDAIHAQREGLMIRDVVRHDVQTTSPDTLVADIMPMAAEAAYPIAVVDGENHLKGIVTKASVLSSLI